VATQSHGSKAFLKAMIDGLPKRLHFPKFDDVLVGDAFLGIPSFYIVQYAKIIASMDLKWIFN